MPSYIPNPNTMPTYLNHAKWPTRPNIPVVWPCQAYEGSLFTQTHRPIWPSKEPDNKDLPLTLTLTQRPIRPTPAICLDILS